MCAQDRYYSADRWMHICVTWNNKEGETKIYNDGKLASTKYAGKDETIKREGVLALFQVGLMLRVAQYRGFLSACINILKQATKMISW